MKKSVFKNFFALFLVIISALTISGCSAKSGGSIKDVSVEDEYINVTFSDTHDQNYYLYPIIYIYKTDYKKYGCKNLNALLKNENFINDHPHYTSFWVAERENGPNYKRHHSTEEIESFSYWLFYDYFAYDSGSMFDVLPEDFNDVKDISNYTGYIKF